LPIAVNCARKTGVNKRITGRWCQYCAELRTGPAVDNKGQVLIYQSFRIYGCGCTFKGWTDSKPVNLRIAPFLNFLTEMKILIVGGGIGGLSTYHSLKKHLPASNVSSITILESHDSPARTLGGGLGLAPNGQRAIASIAPNALTYIHERAFPGSQMTFRNSSGGLLGVFNAGRKERYGYEMVMLPRPVVHAALLSTIPEKDIRWGVKVKTVRESGIRVEVECADGSTEMADLVIGADGVRSAVKASLFNGEFDAEYEFALKFFLKKEKDL